jgi:hypothetical protein
VTIVATGTWSLYGNMPGTGNKEAVA